MFDITTYVKSFFRLFSKKEWLLLAGILLLFAFTRLLYLDQFPVFGDEGIYIRWAKVAWKDATWRFISLTDGRQPLQTWATIPFLKIFPNNALLAGRLFAVSGGLFALTGLVTVTRYLFNARTALVAGFLYVVTPYFLFYDRMALVDAVVNGFIIWMFFLSIVLARTRRLDIALILGFVSGFASLGKSSVRLYIALMLLGVVFVMYRKHETGFKEIFLRLREKLFGRKNVLRDIASFIVLYGVVVAMTVLIYNVQRLSPYMHFIEQKNTTFVLSVSELLADPFNYFSNNIVNIPYYIFAETGFIVATLGVVGFYFMYKKYRVVTLYLLSWVLVALLALSFVARVMFPRYVLPLGGLLVIPAAYLVAQIKDMRKMAAVLGLVLISVLYFNYTIIIDYKNIPFPQVDRGQYLEGWPAGWGIRDIMTFAREKSQEKPVVIIAEGNFGVSHDVLDVFKLEGDQIEIKPYWPLNPEHLAENQDLLADNFVYVVFSHRREFDNRWPMELIEVYDKPGDESEIYLFELLPSPNQ